MFLRFSTRVFRRDLSRVRSRFTTALETLATRGGPRNRVALHIRDRDHRVIKRRIHMRDTRGDILALAPASTSRALSHCLRSPTTWLLFSCPQSPAPDLYASVRLCACAVRGQATLYGAAIRDNNPSPSVV